MEENKDKVQEVLSEFLQEVNKMADRLSELSTEKECGYVIVTYDKSGHVNSIVEGDYHNLCTSLAASISDEERPLHDLIHTAVEMVKIKKTLKM